MKLLKIALYLVGGIVMLPFLLVGLAVQTVGNWLIWVADAILDFTYPHNL